MADRNTENDIFAFREFYETSKTRLTALIDRRNEEIRKEKNPLIRPFQEDFTDLNQGGKMLRGVLVNLGYRIAGGVDLSESDSLAVAFEIFQTGVLIHDDIIDRADLRRGKKTIQRRYEESIEKRGIQMVSGAETPKSLASSAALCVGDLGLYYSNLEIAKEYRDHPNVGELITYFDQIVIDTIRGELLDVVLPYEIQDHRLSEEERNSLLEKSVWEIYHLKTAYYSVIGPLHLGMLLGDLSDEKMELVDSFGNDLGIAFQIKDDILGIYADEKKMGKDAGSDVSEYKQTILYQYVASHGGKEREELLSLYGKENLTPEELKKVQDIFKNSGAYEYATKEMERCFASAGRRLDEMTFLSGEDRGILKGLIEYMRIRGR